MIASERPDGVHLRRLSIKMHRHKGARSGRNGGRDAAGVNIQRLWVRFHGDWCGTRIGNSEPASDVSVSWDDDLVAGADAIPAENQNQSVKSIPYPDAMSGAAVGGKLTLKGVNFVSENKPTGFHNPPISVIQFSLQLQIRSS